MKKYAINKNFENFRDFVFNIESYFTANAKTIHKARNELKIIAHNDLSTVVKSFKIPNIINKIAYTFFRASKAKKSYEYSLKIADFTPEPIAYIEFYKFGLLHNSYFISKEFQYDFTILEPLLDAEFEDREEIFKAFARFTLKLHNANIFHNDYSPGNILIKKENNKFIFKVVDINRMTFLHLNETMRAKNFAKLWASEEILITIANEYKKRYNCSNDFEKKVLHYSLQNKRVKNFKNFKKILKGKKMIKNISVVIIAYNAEKTLKATLDSLIHFEDVVVYVNNSTDNTIKIIKMFI